MCLPPGNGDETKVGLGEFACPERARAAERGSAFEEAGSLPGPTVCRAEAISRNRIRRKAAAEAADDDPAGRRRARLAEIEARLSDEVSGSMEVHFTPGQPALEPPGGFFWLVTPPSNCGKRLRWKRGKIWQLSIGLNAPPWKAYRGD
jgi:hypothetical protein